MGCGGEITPPPSHFSPYRVTNHGCRARNPPANDVGGAEWEAPCDHCGEMWESHLDAAVWLDSS